MATEPGLDGDESLLEEKEATDKAVVPSASVSDILDRFLLWCGNLGALHKQIKKLSLDQRLSDAPGVRHQILVNIEDFNEAIQDRNNDGGADVNDGEREDFDAGDMPMDEAHMNLELMVEAMKSLFQLGVLVQKSVSRDRFQKALQQSTFIFHENFDVDYVQQKYPKLYNTKNRWLSKRLGSASAKRRQFIKYCREHKARLNAHDNETLVLRDGATENLSSKATTFVHNVEPRSLEPASGDDDDAISIMTATTTFNVDTKLKLPALAEFSSGARKNAKDKGLDTGATHDAFVSGTKFKRHVATHQEQLAIFVVPRSSNPDTDEDIGSDGVAAAASRTSFEDNHDVAIDTTETALKVQKIEVERIGREVELMNARVVEEPLTSPGYKSHRSLIINIHPGHAPPPSRPT
ncbi:hypothetical protein DL771_000807 [Monosporascus sp. 5C6A]|nr:hypothetical protein DL771_000807 [Monosporascus sp. 5C6A]